MKRRPKEYAKMLRQQKIYERYITTSRPLGRFRKKHAMDCGGTCYVCKGDKLLRIKSYKDKVADLDMKEQLDETPPRDCGTESTKL